MLLFISYYFLKLIILKQVNWILKEERRHKRTEKFFHLYSTTASMKMSEVLEHEIKVLWLCLIPSV